MHESCAYMTETVFVKSYQNADMRPMTQYEEMCAAGDAEMAYFIRQMSPQFAKDPVVCEFLVNSNRLAQTQEGRLCVCLNTKEKRIAVHIRSRLYLIEGKSMALYQRLVSAADLAIMRSAEEKKGELIFSFGKGL